MSSALRPNVGWPNVGAPIIERPIVGTPIIGVPIIENEKVGTPIIESEIVGLPTISHANYHVVSQTPSEFMRGKALTQFSPTLLCILAFTYGILPTWTLS